MSLFDVLKRLKNSLLVMQSELRNQLYLLELKLFLVVIAEAIPPKL